jgi:hypothetical protein
MADHEPGDTPLAELLELAKITPTDIEHAKAAWERDGRPEFKELLNARPVPAKKPKNKRKRGMIAQTFIGASPMVRAILLGALVTTAATGCAKNRSADEPSTRIRDTTMTAKDTTNPNDTLPHIRDSVSDSTPR